MGKMGTNNESRGYQMNESVYTITGWSSRNDKNLGRACEYMEEPSIVNDAETTKAWVENRSRAQSWRNIYGSIIKLQDIMIIRVHRDRDIIGEWEYTTSDPNDKTGEWKQWNTTTRIKMVAAVSINGVIGIENNIPWIGKYPDDMKFFRTMTKDSVVIMGRKTYDSMGSKPLPKRENFVVSSNLTGHDTDFLGEGVSKTTCASIKEAITAANGKNTWLIGGEGVYTEGLQYAEEIYTTLIPEMVDTKDKSVARFPFIHPLEWKCETRMMSELLPTAGEQKLIVATYRPSKTNWHN
jgi:dihydrofolate reductase